RSAADKADYKEDAPPGGPTEDEPGSAGDLITDIEGRVSRMEANEVIVEQVTGNQLLAFLRTTEEYSFNRKVDEQRVNRLVSIFAKEQENYGYVDLRSTNVCVVITPGVARQKMVRTFLDGQHRRAAIGKLPDPKKVRALLWIKRCPAAQIDTEYMRIN